MPVFLCEQVKLNLEVSEVLRVELFSRDGKWIMWVTELDEHKSSMIHDFTTLLSVDVLASATFGSSTIMLTEKLEDDDTKTLESVCIGCLSVERAEQLKCFVQDIVLAETEKKSGLKAFKIKS